MVLIRLPWERFLLDLNFLLDCLLFFSNCLLLEHDFGLGLLFTAFGFFFCHFIFVAYFTIIIPIEIKPLLNNFIILPISDRSMTDKVLNEFAIKLNKSRTQLTDVCN
jgi:hypothetical protein